MLTVIRERATGWIAWAIVILITIPFALWGINSYFEGGSEISVAAVNGEEITLYAYQEELQARTQLMRERLGESFNPEVVNAFGLKRSVLDNMINSQLLQQYTKDNNFRISDDQLGAMIQGIEVFQVDGKFNLQQYRSVLEANRYTLQSFEQAQRASETINQLRTGIIDTAFVTSDELERVLALQEQTRIVKYALIEAESFNDQVEVSDQEVGDYYSENLEDFMTEAKVKVNYIELGIAGLSEGLSPAEEEISALYEETKGRYRSAESRRASHILIAVDADAAAEDRQEKLRQAEEILGQARSGADFVGLVEQYSEDPGSMNNGGDLGVIALGQMVKPFEDAVYAMNEGDIEGLVETRFGYHIISLTELREEKQQPLSEVRDQVEAELRKARAEDVFVELAESFKNLVFEYPDDISVTAEGLGLPVQTSDWFTENSGQGVAEEAKVRTAAFSEDVLIDNLISPAIEIGFDQLVAVQKHEYEPVVQRKLEEVREGVLATIRNEKSRQQVLSTGAEYLSTLEGMHPASGDWDAFAEEKELVISDLPERRNEISFELSALAESVYASPRPQDGEIKIGGVPLDNGNYALYRISAVKDGNPDDVDETVRADMSQRLVKRDGGELYLGFSAILRENAEVAIFEDQL